LIASGSEQHNRLEIEGTVVVGETLRYTPAGIPVLQFRLVHASQQIEAGRERMVSCEIDVQAFGEVAVGLAGCKPDSRLRLTGFLDRKGVRNPMPNLHVTEFKII
jgi:primosomal replication protein N